FTARPMRVIFTDEDGLEVKKRLRRFNDKLGRATVGRLSFDVLVPIRFGAKNDASLPARINDANSLVVHDRRRMISRRSSHASSLRLPLCGSNRVRLNFDLISALVKRLRRCGTSVMSRQ